MKTTFFKSFSSLSLTLEHNHTDAQNLDQVKFTSRKVMMFLILPYI